MTTPTKEGFYWAKWMIADDHLPEPYTPFTTWEPAEVFLDDGRQPAELRVSLIGHEFDQARDCCHWGAALEPPTDRTQLIKEGADKRKRDEAVRRYRQMTPDHREEWLQAKRRKP